LDAVVIKSVRLSLRKGRASTKNLSLRYNGSFQAAVRPSLKVTGLKPDEPDTLCFGGAMREPERITRIIAKLELVWKCVPDLRLGQIISNLQGPGPQDVFHAEDDQWERRLDDFLKNREKRE